MRLRALLEDRRAELDTDDLAVLDVLKALACVLPPPPGYGIWTRRSEQRDDLAAFARRAQVVRDKYSVPVGERVVSIVGPLARALNPPLRAAPPGSKALRPPPRWPPGSTDTPEGRHQVFARLAAPHLRALARHLPELLPLDDSTVEAKLRDARALRVLIDGDDAPKLAVAVLRAIGVDAKRADNLVNAARRMKATRDRARTKPVRA